MPIPIKALSTAVIGCVLVAAFVAALEKPRMAVLNFAARDSVEEAEAIAEELRGAFVKSGKYIVIDRTQTKQIMKEWETQQSGLTNDKKAIKIGKLHNVKLIVTGKLNKFSGGGWQVSAVMLDAQSGITLKSERVRHKGDFFTLLDQKVPGLAITLAGSRSATPTDKGSQPAQQAVVRNDPGSSFRDPTTGMEFVFLPGGSFEMGCHSGNGEECDGDERPVRQVRLKGFWMGRQEVTQGQWQHVMGNNPSRSKRGDDNPVENVSWKDAQKFIRKLNARSSATFQLPTEAQWEYACRAGGKPVKFGIEKGRKLAGNANYNYNRTTPVRRFRANGQGLYDMSGNVSEWVRDKFTSYSNVGTNEPMYEGSGTYRVYRGGGWNKSSRYLRCSDRSYHHPANRFNYLGFRLVKGG